MPKPILITASAVAANLPPTATLICTNAEPQTGLMDVEEDSIEPDFSFAGRVRTLSPQELRELIEQATYGMEADHPLKRALLRGIGVHHSGLPTKYRQVVEILFRCSYLRVVIATGTRLWHMLMLMHVTLSYYLLALSLSLGHSTYVHTCACTHMHAHAHAHAPFCAAAICVALAVTLHSSRFCQNVSCQHGNPWGIYTCQHSIACLLRRKHHSKHLRLRQLIMADGPVIVNPAGTIQCTL